MVRGVGGFLVNQGTPVDEEDAEDDEDLCEAFVDDCVVSVERDKPFTAQGAEICCVMIWS